MMRQRWAVGAGVLLGLLAVAVTGRADEAGAVKAIEKLGGQVTRDDKQPGNPIVGVGLNYRKVTDAELKQLKELKSLRRLAIGYTEVTDAGLKELIGLKDLRSLLLYHT